MYLIEGIQYWAALIVSGCWQGTSRAKLYDELEWESLSDSRSVRRLTLLYKIKNGIAPPYLSTHIPKRNAISVTIRNRKDAVPSARTLRYDNRFPLILSMELNEKAKCEPSVQSFKNISMNIRKFFIWNTKIRLKFSNLDDHRFNHNFNCDSPICSCGIEDETRVHFFLRCPRNSNQRTTLLSKISDVIGSDVSVFPDEHLYNILVYGGNVFNSTLQLDRVI